MKLTLKSIERAGEKALQAAQDELHGCYVEMFSVINPWTVWLMRHDARLGERRSANICGWQADGLGLRPAEEQR